MLTNPKVICVAVRWLREDPLPSGRVRYVLAAADYQRLFDAVA